MYYVLGIALGLRLILINQSLWLDEAIEALALQGYYGPLLTYSLSDFQPPLYHFLLKGWTTVLGYSELALRFPSLIAGVTLVYVMIKFGQLLHSHRIGLLAGLITATNPLLIYYSQEGRTYMMTTLFVTMSFYFLLKKSSLFYLVSIFLAIWSSYLACLIVPLQLLYLVRTKRRRLAIALTLTFATFLFWVPSLLRSLGLGMGDATAIPEWGKVVGGISWKALALTWVKTAIGRISFTPPWFYGSVVLILIFLHTSIIRHAKKVHPLLWVWLATLGLAALVSFFVPAYSYTRVLFVVPSYLLILALGLYHIKNQSWLYALIATQLVCVCIFWLTPRFHREDWRSLTAFINAKDGAVAMPSRNQLPPLIYYGLARQVFEPSSGVATRDDTIYYIRYAEAIFDPSGLGPAKLSEAGYTVESEVSFTGIPLDIYKK